MTGTSLRRCAQHRIGKDIESVECFWVKAKLCRVMINTKLDDESECGTNYPVSHVDHKRRGIYLTEELD